MSLEFHKLLFHLWDTDKLVVNLFFDPTRSMQWIQRFTDFELCHVKLYGHIYIDNIDMISGFDTIVVINNNGKSDMTPLLYCQWDQLTQENIVTQILGDHNPLKSLIKNHPNNITIGLLDIIKSWKDPPDDNCNNAAIMHDVIQPIYLGIILSENDVECPTVRQRSCQYCPVQLLEDNGETEI